MNARRLIRRFVAARTTVALLCLLALLLLLNVVLPKEAVIGEKSFEELVAGNPVLRFLLVTLGLERMPTSQVFLGVLGLFFLNLAAVLASRVGPTWRRLALRPRSEEGLKAWARMEETFSGSLPGSFGPGEVARTLRGFGFQVRRVGERTFWGVKHRTAPLGFLLFHLSFFLLCVGGILIYYTRFVGTATLTEGQTFAGDYSAILRSPPAGGPPQLSFTVVRAEPRFAAGQPVHLGADFRFRQASSSVARSARVNHPARWGSARILLERAGLAPVLWLQDERGFTLDQVAVPAKTLGGGKPTDVDLAEGRARVLIHPLAPDAAFPSRFELSRAALRFQILQQNEVAFDGLLRPGEGANLLDGRLVLREMRYWVGIRVIAERGGGLLITGFVVGVIGLVWRLLGYRREVVVDWDEEGLRLVGRSEYFSWRYQEELEAIFSVLSQEPAAAETGQPST